MRRTIPWTALGCILVACAPATSVPPTAPAACHPQLGDTGSAGVHTDPSPITFVPPPVPLPGSDARGKTYLTAVFIDTSGTVIPDSTRITPVPHDRTFAQNFANALARRRYRPAMQGGCPIGAWIRISYSFTG